MAEIPFWISHLAARLRWNGGTRGALCILIYHQVLDAPSDVWPGDPDRDQFRRVMRLLARHCNVLPLPEAIDRLQAGTLPPRAVCITFDDGYRNNHDVAWPIMKALGLPATIFVSTGFLDGGCMWNDQVILAVHRCPASKLDLSDLGLGNHQLGGTAERRRVIDTLLRRIKYMPLRQRNEVLPVINERCASVPPTDLMMTSDQVRSLANEGVEIGGHTVNHPILHCEDTETVEWEIRTGKRRLEEIVGHPIDSFAYPNGAPGVDFTRRDVEIVRHCGFRRAVTTRQGCAHTGAATHLLPRFHPWDRSMNKFFARLAISTLRNRAVSCDDG
ncbi:MAG TPA: polysaccharide deacetylase family protein [Thiotrichales bacterium]|nr:polysaccharide deacetylase family protein [Thiotrichales bacterium]